MAGSGDYLLNSDEIQFAWAAAYQHPSEVIEISRIYDHPPLHFLMLHQIQKLSRDAFWIRFPSILCGGLSVFFIGLAGYLARGWLTGLTAAFLTALSPSLVELTRTCRNYSDSFALMLAGLCFLIAFMNEKKWRYYAAYCVLSCLAFGTHYMYIVIITGFNLALYVQFWLRRYDLKSWALLFIGQLPAVVFALYSYITHISRQPAISKSLSRFIHRDHLGVDLMRPWEPFLEISTYLFTPQSAAVAMALVFVSWCVLARKRDHALFAVLVFPVLLAWIFRWTELMPMGDSRHASYLFIFLFLSVGLLVEEILTWTCSTSSGTRPLTPPSETKRMDGDAPYGRSAYSSSSNVAPFAVQLLLTIMAGIFAYQSVGKYDVLASEELSKLSGETKSPLAIARKEFQIHATVDAIPKAISILENEFEDGDLVITHYVGLEYLAWHWGIHPTLSPTEEEAAGPLAPWHVPWPPKDFIYTRDSVKYVQNIHSAWYYTVPLINKNLTAFRQRHGIERPKRVWVLQHPWQGSMSQKIHSVAPYAVFEDRIENETDDLLFRIDSGQLNRLETEYGK